MLSEKTRLLFCLFAASLLIRLVMITHMAVHDIGFQFPFVDEMTNVDQARKFLDEGPTAGTPWWKPPGYPAALALVGSAFENLGPSGQGVPLAYAWVVKMLQAFLDAGVTALLASVAWRWSGRRAALWTGILHSLSWISAYFTGQFLDTTLFCFFIVLGVERLDKVMNPEEGSPVSGREKSWALIGFVTGMAAITRAIALPLGLVYGILAIRSHWNSPFRWNAISALLLGFLLSLGPVMALNRWAGDDQVIVSSNGGINLLIGNRAGGEIGADGLTSVAAGPRWDQLLKLADHLEKPSERSRLYTRLAIAEITADPSAWIQRMGVKALALISARDVPNNKNLVAEEQQNIVLKILRYGLGTSGFLITLLIYGAWKLRRELWSRGLPVMVTILTLAFLTWIFFVAGRYRVPILALGCILGGIGLSRSSLQWRDAFLLILLSILIHLIPIPSRSLMETYCIDPMALGYIYEQRGDLPQAEEWYQRCLAEDPDDVRALHNLGHLLQNRGDFETALKYFENAVVADPNHAPSWNSLGTMLTTVNGPRALEAVRKAVEVDPKYTNAWLNLGQLLESQQMYPGALDAYQRSRRLEPDNQLAILLEARVRLLRNEPNQARRLLNRLVDQDLVPGLTELKERLTEQLETLQAEQR
ncbi:hypothetical protein CBD41_03070 [bacterium TMED181]|nr:hypothetical protein [Planctomycetota bacterium]OUW46057.1 MAG: hypothetical protein CBD41_03070 [bacterium TMED181]